MPNQQLKTTQTQMLASVVSAEEAAIVLDAGVDIVDLKNPAEGALGALPLDTIEAIVKVVDGRAVVSATIGDQPMEPELLVRKVRAMLATGVDVVKIGFFGQSAHRECLQSLQVITAGGARLIAVLFADTAPDFNLLEKIAAAGFYGVMLDTAHKNGRHLLDHCSLAALADFVAKARSLGLQSGLAGALGKAQLADLQKLHPSYLGFRSALCDQSQRTATLNSAQVCELVEMLQGAQQKQINPAFVNQASYALI